MTSKIAGYGLAQPTLSYIRQALVNAFGEAEGVVVWQDMCRQLELDLDRDENDLTVLGGATQWLMARQDLGKVVGCSMSIRLIAFQELQARMAAERRGGDA